MIRNRWNALQVGHHVLVHDETDPSMRLLPGRVTLIEPAVGSNHVTIRVSPPTGQSRTVQPRRLAVHSDGDGDGTVERCWRCEVNDPMTPAPAARGASPRRATSPTTKRDTDA